MSIEPQLKILIVDDHPLVREGLKAQLGSHPNWRICGEAETSTEALHMMRDASPDVVIIDLSLKSGSGMELIKQVTAMPNGPRCLVCSMHDESLYAERAIQAGALGFVHKQQASEQIVQAIEHVAQGKLFVSENVQQHVLSRLLRNPDSAHKEPIDQLTGRELQIFEAIGQGKTVSQIAASLLLSNKTVETYRERTKRKLNVRTSAELIRYAVKWVDEHANG